MARWGVSDNNRRAKFYSLTRPGRKQVVREAEDWERIVAVMGAIARAGRSRVSHLPEWLARAVRTYGGRTSDDLRDELPYHGE